MKKTKKYILSATLLLLLGAAGGAFYVYRELLTPVFGIDKPVRLYVDGDDNIDSVRHKMTMHLSPRSMRGFEWMAGYYGYAGKIRTGCFTFTSEDNMRTAFRRLSAGWQTPVKLVVPSVRTVERMAASLASQLMVGEEELLALLGDTAVIRPMGYTRETLPALFVPNTYEVYWNVSADKLLERLEKEHARFWNKGRLAQAEAQGLTPVEVATLAGIVDEETANRGEMPVVAGLYLNRLRRGMLLQADPTVKFALQDFGLRRILNVHLQTDSPYNTYLYAGLPPGPIRIPTVAAIESVLNPAKHSFLYMCAKEDFSGTHNFATTLAEHNRNARRYQQALNRRGIK